MTDAEHIQSLLLGCKRTASYQAGGGDRLKFQMALGPIPFLLRASRRLNSGRYSGVQFILQGLRLYLAGVFGMNSRPVQVRFETEFRRVELALRSYSDLSVVYEVFAERIYQVSPGFAPTTILDLGSNIGVSVAFFNLLFPEAAIVAVEPDPWNLPLLTRNCGSNPKVMIVDCAVSDENGKSRLYAQSRRGAASSLVDREGCKAGPLVRTVTLDTLLQQAGDFFPELIKFDIEGSEMRVLSHYSGLSRVGCLVGEFHEDLSGVSLDEFVGLFELTHELATRQRGKGRFEVMAVRRSNDPEGSR